MESSAFFTLEADKSIRNNDQSSLVSTESFFRNIESAGLDQHILSMNSALAGMPPISAKNQCYASNIKDLCQKLNRQLLRLQDADLDYKEDLVRGRSIIKGIMVILKGFSDANFYGEEETEPGKVLDGRFSTDPLNAKLNALLSMNQELKRDFKSKERTISKLRRRLNRLTSKQMSLKDRMKKQLIKNKTLAHCIKKRIIECKRLRQRNSSFIEALSRKDDLLLDLVNSQNDLTAIKQNPKSETHDSPQMQEVYHPNVVTENQESQKKLVEKTLVQLGIYMTQQKSQNKTLEQTKQKITKAAATMEKVAKEIGAQLKESKIESENLKKQFTHQQSEFLKSAISDLTKATEHSLGTTNSLLATMTSSQPRNLMEESQLLQSTNLSLSPIVTRKIDESLLGKFRLLTTQISSNKKREVIGDFWTHLAIKSSTSYLLGTNKKGLHLVNESTIVYSKKLPENCMKLWDLIYVKKMDCYFLCMNSQLFRKNIDTNEPYLYLDIKFGNREGASMRYSEECNRLVVDLQFHHIAVICLEKKTTEVYLNKNFGGPIMDFRLMRESLKSLGVMSSTQDGFIFMSKFEIELKTGFI